MKFNKCYRCDISSSDIKKSIYLKAQILTNILKYYAIPLDICYEIVQFLHKDFYSFIYPVLFIDSGLHSRVETSYYKVKTCLLCPSCYKFGILKSYSIYRELPTGHSQGIKICNKINSSRNKKKDDEINSIINKFFFPNEYSCEYHIRHKLIKTSNLYIIQ
tara:strand:- start:285 stop:767 length:483 start_codon:yes stop_codon:yes gene_type:complete